MLATKKTIDINFNLFVKILQFLHLDAESMHERTNNVKYLFVPSTLFKTSIS